jgi:hypothetical protein
MSLARVCRDLLGYPEVSRLQRCSRKAECARIHTLDNVMTLDPIIHDWFDRLEIWSEAVVSDFIFLSLLTLNIRRMAWKTHMLFMLREKVALVRARQTQ